MLIFTKIEELENFICEAKSRGQSIGFIPTMGALHKGHVSLINASQAQCNISVCSIFINPYQFNSIEDFEKYPKTPKKDILILKKARCRVLFMPSVEEIYDKEEKVIFNFGELEKILEGKYRPGHFNGVAQIIKKLIGIVKPDKAFFGSKDFQQVLIIEELIKQIGSHVEIIRCSILREKDGLAMSSRNTLLADKERKLAGLIPKIMQDAKDLALSEGIYAAKLFVNKAVSTYPMIKLDYYEVCDFNTLKILNDTEVSSKKISLMALFIGKIRLIDNLVIN